MSKILLLGSLNDFDSKIKKFLRDFSKESFERPERWEKKIWEFFSKEAFVFYVGTIQKTEEELDKIQQELTDHYMSFMKSEAVHLDTNEMFKNLIEMWKFIEHGGDTSEYYRALFYYNFLIRRMFTKVVDRDDGNYKKFSAGISSQNWILGKDNNKLFQRIWIVLPDNTVPYPFKDYYDKVDKLLDREVKKILKDGSIIRRKRDPIESRLRHEVFKRDKYMCKECGKTNKETTLHCDHILPVAQGGSDELDNLQTLCQACNLAKTNRKWIGGKNE